MRFRNKTFIVTEGAIDVLCNNVGINRRGNLLSLTPEDWRLSFAINVDAMFHLCQAALPRHRMGHSSPLLPAARLFTAPPLERALHVLKDTYFEPWRDCDPCDAGGQRTWEADGPSADTMRAPSDKPSARRVAIQASIPIIPPTEVLGEEIEAIKKEAAGIGYPLMLKASWGSCGRGTRCSWPIRSRLGARPVRHAMSLPRPHWLPDHRPLSQAECHAEEGTPISHSGQGRPRESRVRNGSPHWSKRVSGAPQPETTGAGLVLRDH